MKTLPHSIILAVLLFGAAAMDLCAQIRDDESSTSYLATQCAVSAGGDAANYEEYSRRLAKTVALLSPGQQERVFGFVPQPITFARPEDSAQSSNGYGSYAGTPTVPEETESTTPVSTVGNGQTGDEGSSPVEMGSTSGEGGGDAGEPTEETSVDPSPEPVEPEYNWWEDFSKWLDGLVDSIVESIASWQQA
ncbi:MAG: hypothetical protein AAF357_10810 [Verrucomicrobiota bacterium]